MILESLQIANYKSLRSIYITPDRLAVFVGPNGAGKSNLADALDFLAEAYEYGLEVAVARKGGYENIAYRKGRRSRSAIVFEVVTRFEADEGQRFLMQRGIRSVAVVLRVHHRFAFRSSVEAIRADFRVSSESFRIYEIDAKEKVSVGTMGKLLFSMDRGGDGRVVANGPTEKGRVTRVMGDYIKRVLEWLRAEGEEQHISPQELMVGAPQTRNRFVSQFSAIAGTMKVFRFSPELMRVPGIPTPNPKLSTRGENLPAIVDWLARRQPGAWSAVLNSMRDIVPGLADITVNYLTNKSLGLFFEEEGFGRRWQADEVSDGTLQVLSELVSLADPRNSLLVIEEPEKAVHPWIIKELAKRFRDTSMRKTVLLTTHSNSLIDCINPEEIWVVYRRGGETQIKNLTVIDPKVSKDWKSGVVRISDYLGSGLCPECVPGGE